MELSPYKRSHPSSVSFVETFTQRSRPSVFLSFNHLIYRPEQAAEAPPARTTDTLSLSVQFRICEEITNLIGLLLTISLLARIQIENVFSFFFCDVVIIQVLMLSHSKQQLLATLDF